MTFELFVQIILEVFVFVASRLDGYFTYPAGVHYFGCEMLLELNSLGLANCEVSTRQSWDHNASHVKMRPVIMDNFYLKKDNVVKPSNFNC